MEQRIQQHLKLGYQIEKSGALHGQIEARIWVEMDVKECLKLLESLRLWCLACGLGLVTIIHEILTCGMSSSAETNVLPSILNV